MENSKNRISLVDCGDDLEISANGKSIGTLTMSYRLRPNLSDLIKHLKPGSVAYRFVPSGFEGKEINHMFESFEAFKAWCAEN